MVGSQTFKRLLWEGVWWPTMKKEAHSYVWACINYSNQYPKPHATLFQVMIAPDWSSYIIDYLKHRVLPENVEKARRKAIELEPKDYEIIANQFYKTWKDKQLRLCVRKAEYVRVLEQAYARLTGGHFSSKQDCKSNHDGRIMVAYPISRCWRMFQEMWWVLESEGTYL